MVGRAQVAAPGGDLARRLDERERPACAQVEGLKARGRGACRKLAAAERLELLADRAEKVSRQITQRVAGEKITDRLVSLADPDARPIGKGKLGKRYEFGYVFQLAEITENTRRGARGLLLPAPTKIGSPNEPELLPATVAELGRAGVRLREAAFDGGFEPGLGAFLVRLVTLFRLFSRGIQVPPVTLPGLSVPITSSLAFYYFSLAVVGVAVFALKRILDSPFGAVLQAIRENSDRAAACGYDVDRVKHLSFVFSALFCGLAGALDALRLTVVPVESLYWSTSGQAVIMTLLGGAGTFFGPFVGAATWLVLQDRVSVITESWALVIGAVFMAFVLFLPRGLWGTLTGGR